MISVVCSTRNISDSFVSMVKKTSGFNNIEVLMYENNGEMSLTQVYNKGLYDAKFDIVVFMHDDIEILTKNWGKILISHYEKTDYAILGVAGTKRLDESGVWWSNKESMYGVVRHTDGKKTWTNSYSYNFGKDIKEVVVVDGVFFSCNKKRIKKTFDESYGGFHFYDISFCFDNFKENAMIGVHFDILITHKSVGEVNDQWNNNRLQFIDKEIKNLPQKSFIDVSYVEPNIIIKDEKKLAVIIPTKNHVDDLLIPCILSICSKTKYKNYKIYIADTGSEPEELDKMKKIIGTINKTSSTGENHIELIEYDYYNFAKINNDVVKNKIDSDTELILFCNNDIEMLNDAISIMAKTHNNNKDKVGTVGCRLHYEDGSIQHLGISLQVNSKNELLITHKFIGWDYDNIKNSTIENYTHGNTAAFMLVSKDLFLNIGGFNETYTHCFEDVEFNLKCMLNKKVNITTNMGVCYHFESKTRTRDGEKQDLDMLLKFINANNKIKETFNKIN